MNFHAGFTAYRTQLFHEYCALFFLNHIVMNPVVSVTGLPKACSARIAADRHTHRLSILTLVCALRVEMWMPVYYSAPMLEHEPLLEFLRFTLDFCYKVTRPTLLLIHNKRSYSSYSWWVNTPRCAEKRAVASATRYSFSYEPCWDRGIGNG